jgi:hypothetical protein
MHVQNGRAKISSAVGSSDNVSFIRFVHLFSRIQVADISIDSELLRDILLDERSEAIDEHVDRNAQGL